MGFLYYLEDLWDNGQSIQQMERLTLLVYILNAICCEIVELFLWGLLELFL